MLTFYVQLYDYKLNTIDFHNLLTQDKLLGQVHIMMGFENILLLNIIIIFWILFIM